MALFNSVSHLQTQMFPSLLISIFLFPYLLQNVVSVSFNFSNFTPNMNKLHFEGDAFPSSGVLQLTKNQVDGPLTSSTGRTSYAQPVRLWDASTGKLTDFTTHFSFVMKAVDESYSGDGISFFIAPFDSQLPSNSSGGLLALVSYDTAFDASKNKFVAIEFDSNEDKWDPSDNHVGIDVNSIVSVTNITWKTTIKNGSVANAWVSYNSITHNLTVFLTYAKNPTFTGENCSLSYVVDLRNELPEKVRVGFSAATGYLIEVHNILSWSFSSSLESNNGANKVKLAAGLGIGFGVLTCGLVLFWLTRWRKKAANRDDDYDMSMDDEFDKGTGPRRFTYREISRATNSFAEGGKLGEGGFGGVFKGLLSESNTEVAVKRVSRTSKQGKKEYVAEVRIISRLRHRNLVQLIGWCHEKGEFLLVYEIMPNGSLDSYLFGKSYSLSWPVRYKIALGLASAVLYLHEEWEQCVVHRDIKSSNVMLDANFNAKLGDFGLARLVDHELGSQTTVLAGTMGYLAPECVTTGKASKESDVYSFGVVSLEISCGRKPVEAKAEASKVRLVEWVWDLYGKGQILEAVDERLRMIYDEKEIKCLMVVGLWCCHPDPTVRPSIRQVINVLSFEAPMPSLPSKLPVPMYFAPLDMCQFSYTSSKLTGSSVQDRTHCSCSTCSTFNSSAAGSSKALLKLNKSIL
ncbi:L-type lectin-domain containing receptor kinase IX.1-like [Argentina anserina]|uniref:L-type lectin-domain containing receptor kinase IX.1-like n=1 Tax=Argentina anserina TaxID=57926 RepID=UPI0021763094|nr:L-type lectin-domain containing receptor kinase IX.1-like [Potentilla anserina]